MPLRALNDFHGLADAPRLAETILGLVPDTGVMVLDTELRIVLMDGEFPAQMGTNLGPHWRAALAGEACTVDSPSGDGQRDYWLHFAPLRPRDGEPVGAILVAQDVTARLRGEQIEGRLGQESRVSALGAELLDAAARTVHAGLGEDLVLVLEHCPAGGVIVRAEAGDLAPDLPAVPTAGVRRSIGVLREMREPVLSHDLGAEPRFETPTLQAAGMLSLVAAPIGSGNDAFGTLLACSRRRGAFSEADLGLLQSVGDMLSHAANLS